MLASLRWRPQGPRGHAPPPSPGSAAPSSPDEAPNLGRARWPDPPLRSFWRVHRGFPCSSGVAQGGRSPPRSSSADRRGQGAGGAAGSSLRRSWRKVRARTWKRLGPPWSRCWVLGVPRGLPGWLGGRVGGGVRRRAAARGHPLCGSSLPLYPTRRLGLLPGPVHPACASGAECAGPGAQVRLPPRRLAGPRAALGRPQPSWSAAGAVPEARPPHPGSQPRREESGCGVGEELPGRAARGELLGPEWVGDWLPAQLGCPAGEGAGQAQRSPEAGRRESRRPSLRDLSSSEGPRGWGHLLPVPVGCSPSARNPAAKFPRHCPAFSLFLCSSPCFSFMSSPYPSLLLFFF